MFTQGPSAQLGARVQGLGAQATSPNFGVGYLEKGVFTLVLSLESYPGTKCEHCLSFESQYIPFTVSIVGYHQVLDRQCGF